MLRFRKWKLSVSPRRPGSHRSPGPNLINFNKAKFIMGPIFFRLKENNSIGGHRIWGLLPFRPSIDPTGLIL